MRNIFFLIFVVFGVLPHNSHAQGQYPPRPPSLAYLDNKLLYPDQIIRVAFSESMGPLEFWFRPASRFVDPVLLGVVESRATTTYGPECGNDGGELCETNTEYSIQLGTQLATLSEGWAQLAVREQGESEDLDSAIVYWDDTPPQPRFLYPRFEAAKSVTGFPVVVHSFDEDLIRVSVQWILLNENNREIPRFEQHELGADFAGHAACVPTSFAASLKWLNNTGQWCTWKPFFSDDFTVNSLGFFMSTTTSGTTAANLESGIEGYLEFWFGYKNGVHYTGRRLGNEAFGPSETQFGFTPEALFEQFQAGGAVMVGLHNKPIQPGDLFDPMPDPAFGHTVVLSYVELNMDGTAWITVMDPHLSPPETQGVFRTFLLHPNGLIDWTAANPGYYNPPSGTVAVDELYTLRDFELNPENSDCTQTAQSLSGHSPAGGYVEGLINLGGHTWIGNFTPPTDSVGPWLLMVEATDSAGFTQKDYQYVTP